ncbi:MAG: hypothetical protein VCF25_21005 [Candidatus Poribacteria bacterium]
MSHSTSCQLVGEVTYKDVKHSETSTGEVGAVAGVAICDVDIKGLLID